MDFRAIGVVDHSEVKLPSVMATEKIEELFGEKRDNLNITSDTKIQFVVGLEIGCNANGKSSRIKTS